MNPALIQRWALETRFPPDQLEKVLRLRQLLTEFWQHPFLRNKLVLKGGTALNVFYSGMSRLSVDIDLNYIGAVEPEGMRSERPELELVARQLAATLGYTVREGTQDYALFQIYLGYTNHLGRSDRLEVEINYLHRVTVLDAIRKTAVQVSDEPACQFLVLAEEELLAGKYKAMIDRTHPRDLYDLYRFEAAKPAPDRTLLRRLTLLLCATLRHDLNTYTLERCLRTRPGELETQLYPLLRAGDRPTLEEMQSVVAPELEAILKLSSRSEFLQDIAQGLYSPAKLFPDRADLVERIAAHPALLWKTENVARHLSQGRQIR